MERRIGWVHDGRPYPVLIIAGRPTPVYASHSGMADVPVPVRSGRKSQKALSRLCSRPRSPFFRTEPLTYWPRMVDVCEAVAYYFDGRVPSKQDLQAATPVILDAMCDGDEATRRKYADELADVLSHLPTDGSNDVALLSRKEFERKQTALRDLDDARAAAAADAVMHAPWAHFDAAAELMAAPDSPAATGAPAQGCGDTIMHVPEYVAQARVPPVKTSLHDTVVGTESEPAGNHNGELSASMASASTDPVQETHVAVHNVADAVAVTAATETTVNSLTPASDPSVRALPCVLCVFGLTLATAMASCRYTVV
jgi:hypothetical protein